MSAPEAKVEARIYVAKRFILADVQERLMKAVVVRDSQGVEKVEPRIVLVTVKRPALAEPEQAKGKGATLPLFEQKMTDEHLQDVGPGPGPDSAWSGGNDNVEKSLEEQVSRQGW